jgi:hypothetical protein
LSQSKKPTRELSIEETINQTFTIYSAKFLQYLIPFLIASIITGTITMTISESIEIPPAPSPIIPQKLTTEEIQKWLPTFSNYLSAILTIAILTIITWWIITNIAAGIAAKYTADVIEKDDADLKTSLNYTTAKLLPLLTVSIITLILIILGLIAFVIPGIILTIMFSLTIPTIIIENTGILRSLKRSRLLVSHRWLKTFGLLLLLYTIIITASVLVSIISLPFGEVSTLISSILSAFILPILPIGLTIHYYSMIARTTPQEPTQT